MAGVTIGDLDALARGKLAGLSKEAEEKRAADADIREKWDGAHAENSLFDKRRAALAHIARLEIAERAREAEEAERARLAAMGGSGLAGTAEDRAQAAFERWAGKAPEKAAPWREMWALGIRPY